ncbi:MAG: hypothetical protein AAFX93_08345 [Verrucomicrobiota bacterium]
MNTPRMNDLAAIRYVREVLGKMGIALKFPLVKSGYEYRVGVAVDAVTYDVKGKSTRNWEEAFAKAGFRSIPNKVYHPRYQKS